MRRLITPRVVSNIPNYRAGHATRVLRLRAPNPGLLTGPGTNTYVIVSEDECVIIDPGPIEETHRAAIRDTVEEVDPRAVIVTHTHSDHAPLANPLSAEFGVRCYGYASGPDFDPDRRLRDGDRIRFGRATVEVLYTPGHSNDHLSFLLGDTLFTGDHIMGGSTVVVEDMTSYLRSLERVRETDPARLMPGHGEPMDDPAGVVSEYLEHRMAREGQIIGAVRSGAETVGAVVRSVYGGIDPRLHPAAAVTVLAHLRKLDEEGAVDLDVTGHGAVERSLLDNLGVRSKGA